MEFLTRTSCVVCAACVAIAMILSSGCEDNNSDTQSSPSTTTEFRINPSGFNMSTNVSQIALTVVGGVSPFTWTRSAPALGTLSGTSTTSRIVNYTVTAGQTGVNTIRVQDTQGWSASSVIVQGQ
jgi:hypothetical protein